MSQTQQKEEPDREGYQTLSQSPLERLLIEQISKLSLQDFGLNSRVKRTLIRR